MAQNSNIEWCHHTANLWWGCTEVHEGCDNCYAKAMAERYQTKPLESWDIREMEKRMLALKGENTKEDTQEDYC